MKIRYFIAIIFLISLTSCLSHISSKIGEGIGYTIDSIETKKPVTKRVCNFSDPAIFKYADKPYAYRYGNIGARIGIYGDLGIGLYIASTGGVAILGGLFYLIGSPFSWGAVDTKLSENYRSKPEVNISDGWLSNSTSECSNVEDFFLYRTYRDRNDKTICEEFIHLEKENFYDVLIKKSDLDKSSREKLTSLIGEPIWIPRKQENGRCDVEFYIQFPGGKDTLKKSL